MHPRIHDTRYQTDREKKSIVLAVVVGSVAAARATLIVIVVVVVVSSRDGGGSGDGYQNCACHYNFKAGFPRSTVAWSVVQEAGGGGRSRIVEGWRRKRKRRLERAIRGGHR